MKKKWESITINGVTFELNTKDKVTNPFVYYRSVCDVYGRCSAAKKDIWEDWASWFRSVNSHMFGVTSHNSNFFTIEGCFTWVDEFNKPVEYYAVITKGHNRLWKASRA